MSTRQIVLDTETTGLDPEEGHRIIEIGCVELINRRATGNTFQQYLHPQRDIDEGALAVHGITNEFLADKPRFADIVTDLLNYIKGAELIIHNAGFDVGFLDYELGLLPQGVGRVDDYCTVLDTLQLARELHPGQRNDLDALCRRYEIDNSQRTLHGAVLDAEILADVYLSMTGGQTKLLLDAEEEGLGASEQTQSRIRRADLQLPVLTASVAELAEHEAWCQRLERDSGVCLWRKLEAQADAEPDRLAGPVRTRAG